MIASPGDVFAERDAARDVVHDWNSMHSREVGTVLLPVGWDTHASPEMGTRAQGLINERVLAHSDLLVAIFWHRVGTPTGDFPSGSVEELHRHMQSGKPAMVYFSTAPVPDDADADQIAALGRFREWCNSHGLVRTFENAADFEKQFGRHLQQELYQNQYLRGLMSSTKSAGGVGSPGLELAPPGSGLLDESRQLLAEASKDDQGIIGKLRHLAGLTIQANGRTFGEPANPRSMARWTRALDELADKRLVQAVGHKGEVFRVTDSGYELADKLAASESHDIVPLKEAATILYEEARESGSIWADAAERLGAFGMNRPSSEDEVLNYMATYIGKRIPVFGMRPPSRRVESMDEVIATGTFEDNATEFRLSGSPGYTNLRVKRGDLDELIGAIKRGLKSTDSI